jgi:hypothetical protein
MEATEVPLPVGDEIGWNSAGKFVMQSGDSNSYLTMIPSEIGIIAQV